VGTLTQSNGHSLTVRDICRLANVLISEQQLKNVIVGRTMGNKTLEGAKLLGAAWKKRLEEINLCSTLRNLVVRWESLMTRVRPRTSSRACRQEVDVAFPFLPLYVGYSKALIGRQTAHRSGSSPSDGILIPVLTTIESLNQLVNGCVSRRRGTNLSWKYRIVYNNWNEWHFEGRVCSLQSLADQSLGRVCLPNSFP